MKQQRITLGDFDDIVSEALANGARCEFISEEQEWHKPFSDPVLHLNFDICDVVYTLNSIILKNDTSYVILRYINRIFDVSEKDERRICVCCGDDDISETKYIINLRK